MKTKTDKSKKEPKKSDSKTKPNNSDKKSDNKPESTKNDSETKTQSKTDVVFPELLARNAIRISHHGYEKCLINKKGALSCWWLKSTTDNKWTIFKPEGFESKTTDVSVGNNITCAINKVGVTCWRTSY